jgi:hypothetical protein
MMRGTGTTTLRRNARQLLSHYWAESHTYGRPPMDAVNAQEILDNFIQTQATSEDYELDDTTRAQLKKLGYRN